MMRNSEKDHYEKILKESQNNLKNTWRMLKEIINKKKSSKVCSKFILNNNVTTNKKAIADGFNTLL